MEKIFLVSTNTTQDWQIIGGNYLVKAINKEDAELKIISVLNDNNLYEEYVHEVLDIQELEYKNDIFQINDFIIE